MTCEYRTRLRWFFFFSSRRRHTRCGRDWSSDVCSSDLEQDLLRESVRRFMKAECTRDYVRLCSDNDRFPQELYEKMADRSEERRVGKECRSRWWPDQ